MQRLEGRVAIVTGSGRGIGRAYALELAAEGAAVVVNDLGADPSGSGADKSPAEEVVAEIRNAGGKAIASFGDVSNWNTARAIVDSAIKEFGDLHILINNAGFLLHSTIQSTTEEDWDRQVAINLKGHMAMTKWAMAHWAAQKESGKTVKASIINTTSIGTLLGLGVPENSCPGYSSTKGGVLHLGLAAAIEGAPIGVRANVIGPGGRTRLTTAFQGEEKMNQKIGGFDISDPANIAPLIVYLSMEDCPITGAVLNANGNQITLFRQWPIQGTREAKGRWSVDVLETVMPDLLEGKFAMPSRGNPFDDLAMMSAKAKAALT